MKILNEYPSKYLHIHTYLNKEFLDTEPEVVINYMMPDEIPTYIRFNFTQVKEFIEKLQIAISQIEKEMNNGT